MIAEAKEMFRGMLGYVYAQPEFRNVSFGMRYVLKLSFCCLLQS